MVASTARRATDMVRKALYFPYIRTPDDDWFTRVVLYWDSVGTIVPGGLELDERYVTPRMKELSDHGMLELVHPMGSMQWAEREGKFREAFLSLVDNNPELQARLKSPEQMAFSRVHLWKLGALAKALVERGLARYIEGDGRSWELWIEVESSTADLFMAYLALALASDPDGPMEPVTNHPGSLAALANGTPGQPGPRVKAARRMRAHVLEELLPAPGATTTVAELVAFKREHNDRLVLFRDAIDRAVMAAASDPDPDAQQELLRIEVARFVGERDAIRQEMEKRRWPGISLGSAAVLVGTTPQFLDAAEKHWLLGLLAGGGVIAAAYQLVKDIVKPEDYLSKPMAYAAFAAKAGG
jgi:hypothetical protein